MGLAQTYDTVLLAGLCLAAVAGIASVWVKTPYGRFAAKSPIPSLPIRLGWILMESPAALFFPIYFMGEHAFEPVPLLFLGIWTMHYTNRAMLFPLLMRARPGSVMSWLVVVSGWVVVPVHAWLYATWITRLGDLGTSWLTTPYFLVGLPLYLVGFGLIVHTEHTLRRLRDEGEGYRIPYGGGFRWVSSPHYLGEILAFTGLALATGCPGGLFVLCMTLANLVPRAVATHRWYQSRFPDYPSERRALVPFLV